jgi:hypothetical protein
LRSRHAVRRIRNPFALVNHQASIPAVSRSRSQSFQDDHAIPPEQDRHEHRQERHVESPPSIIVTVRGGQAAMAATLLPSRYGD